MRKLLLTLLLCCFICTPVLAQEEFEPEASPRDEGVILKDMADGLPAARSGFAFSLVDNKFNVLTTLEAKRWFNDRVILSFGYAGVADDTGHKVVGTLEVELFKLKNVLSKEETPSTLGIVRNFLVDAVDVSAGGYFGAGRLEKDLWDSETDYGVTLSALKYRFW